MNRIKTTLFLNLAAATMLLGCSPNRFSPAADPTLKMGKQDASNTSIPSAKSLLEGSWGGMGIYLSADRNGADLDFDCALGEIAGPVEIDSNGNFNVAGTYFPSHGGPTLPVDDVTISPTGVPVHYVGIVNGSRLTLRIVFDQYTNSAAKNDLVPDNFNLVLNNAPRMHRCAAMDWEAPTP